MQACSMAPSAFAPTLVHREPVMLDSAHMAVLEIALSKCVEGLATSIFSTLMHIKPQLMIGAAGALLKTYTTKNGMLTWISVAQ